MVCPERREAARGNPVDFKEGLQPRAAVVIFILPRAATAPHAPLRAFPFHPLRLEI